MPRIDATIHLGHVLQMVTIVVAAAGAVATIGNWQGRIDEKLAYVMQRVEKLEAVDATTARELQRLAEEMARLQATLAATNAAVTRLEATLNRQSSQRSGTP